VVSSPQRRAIQTAEPVAAARELPVEIDDRFAEYDRDLAAYIPSSTYARKTPRSGPTGPGPSAQCGRRRRLSGAGAAAVADLVSAGDPEEPSRLFSHAAVINLLLHEILGTARMLSFQVDYASVTRLLCTRDPPGDVRRSHQRTRMGRVARNQRLLDGN